MSRLAPELPFPPYAYTPKGAHPHPTRDPAGHSFARPATAVAPPQPARWDQCQLYLYGIDLFNHGYYWEAHEVWERLWQACGRRGVSADFLKALIALTAAGVKQRERSAGRGAQRHAARCRNLLEGVRRRLGRDETHYLGLELAALSAIARRLAGGGAVIAERLMPARAGNRAGEAAAPRRG